MGAKYFPIMFLLSLPTTVLKLEKKSRTSIGCSDLIQSFAGGSLLAVVLCHLLPEVFEQVGEGNTIAKNKNINIVFSNTEHDTMDGS